jgi:hypothetical protein
MKVMQVLTMAHIKKNGFNHQTDSIINYMMINGLIHWKTWTKNSEKTEQYFKITST